MMDTQMLMDKLVKAVSFQFKDDKTSPGVTVSALKKGYYASVVRYEGSFAKGKVVVCKAKGDTLEQALVEVAQRFLGQVKLPKNPIDELDGAVNTTSKKSKFEVPAGNFFASPIFSRYRDDTDVE